MERKETGYDRHTTEKGCEFAQNVLFPPHLKQYRKKANNVKSEERNQGKIPFLSFCNLSGKMRKGKHMKKKMLAMLLAAGMVISLAACGTSKNGSVAEEKTDNGKTETADVSEKEETENTEEDG